MEFLQGLTDLCWLGPTCKADWNAWAALGTLAAVLYAVFASRIAFNHALKLQKRAHADSLDLQGREWIRQDMQRKIRTARLANLFHRDIVYAARALTLALANLEPRRFATFGDDGPSYLLESLPKNQLRNVERFAGELDGFEDRDALALLTALVSWQDFSDGVTVPKHHLTIQRAQLLAANIRTTVAHMRAMHVELNDRMITYFKDMPEITGVVEDEIPAELLDMIRGEPVHPPASSSEPNS